MKMFRVHDEADDLCWIDLDKIEAVYPEWDKNRVVIYLSGVPHVITGKFVDNFLIEFEKLEINSERDC